MKVGIVVGVVVLVIGCPVYILATHDWRSFWL